MNRHISKIVIFGVGAAAVAGLYAGRRALAAGVPQTDTLVYSGTLLNNGQPDTGSHFIILKLWTAGASSAACATIPSGNTQLVSGRFSVPFDSSCVQVIHQNQDVQVEVVIDGNTMGKTPLKAVPYALEADTASNPAPGSAIAALVPAGTINAYGGVVSPTVSPPPGWLLCNGSAVSRTQYAALFSAIGTSFGGGDGASTFNLPDLRGRFLRGVDPNGSRDPDGASRTPMAAGGNPGNQVGSVQDSQFGSHDHGGVTVGNTQPAHTNPSFDYSCSGGGGGIPFTSVGCQANFYNAHEHNIPAAGGNETRPINANVNYIIKI